MRILHIIPFFTPQMGGSAQVCYQLAGHLGARGHEVTVVSSDFGTQRSAFPSGPFRVTFLPNLVARWGFYLTPSLLPWARENIGHFDIIHLHTVRTFQNAVIRHYALRHHIPLILSAHGTLPVIVERQLPKKIYDLLVGERLLKTASRLVAVSGREVEQYRRAGVEPGRIRLIYNGLDLKEFDPLPSRGCFRSRVEGLEPGTKIILFLGRLHKVKGIDGLMKAFATLQWNSSPVLLFIVGPDEGELNHLRRLAVQLGIVERVHFVGPLYGEEKLAALVDADILASPAAYEIFGLAPFEALLCGTPVVVGEEGGTGELFAASGAGYRVRYGEVEQLAHRLEHILMHPQEAQRKVQRGKDFVRQKLDWQVISGELEKVYREVIS